MTTDLVSPEQEAAKEAYLKTIRAAGASDREISHLMYLAKEHGLDPIKREIYLLPFKNDGKKEFIPFVSYFGLIKCAHKSGYFDGIEEELVFSEDGKIIGARARVWTKGSNHPCIAMGLLKEYDKCRSVWSTMPGAMIMKCVKSRALRDAFNLEGLYIEEEFKVPALNEGTPYEQQIKERKKQEDIIIAGEEAF